MERLVGAATAAFLGVLATTLLLSPWPLGSRLPWAGMAVASLLVAAAGLLAAALYLAGHLTPDRLALPIAAFLAWSFVQAAGWSAYPHGTRVEAFQYLAWGATFLLLRQITRPQSAKFLSAVVLLAAAAVFAFGLYQHATWNGKLFWYYDPPYGGTAPFASFNNRNHFAGYAVAALGPAFGLMLAGRGGWRLAGLLASLLGAAAVLLSLSRGGFLATTAAFLLVAAVAWQHSKRTDRAWGGRLLVASAVALMLLASGSFLVLRGMGMGEAVQQRLATLLDPASESSAVGRFQIWRDTLPMIAARPIRGHGLNTFAWANVRFRSTGDDSLPQHAHNEYLEVMAESGLIGAALCVWFLALLLGEIASRARGAGPGFETGLRLGCLAAWAGMLVLALTDFPTVIPATNLLLAVAGGLGSAHWDTAASDAQRS